MSDYTTSGIKSLNLANLHPFGYKTQNTKHKNQDSNF